MEQVFRITTLASFCSFALRTGRMPRSSSCPANATSAFSAIWLAYTDGLYACGLTEAPWWIMSAAGLFVGLFAGRFARGVRSAGALRP